MCCIFKNRLRFCRIVGLIGCLTNATLRHLALHCIKLCSICKKSRYLFGYLLFCYAVGLEAISMQHATITTQQPSAPAALPHFPPSFVRKLRILCKSNKFIVLRTADICIRAKYTKTVKYTPIWLQTRHIYD